MDIINQNKITVILNQLVLLNTVRVPTKQLSGNPGTCLGVFSLRYGMIDFTSTFQVR